MPNTLVSLECPAPECPCGAQSQSVPGVPNPRVSLEWPTPEYPWSAQSQTVPGVPSTRVSLAREDGVVEVKYFFFFFFHFSRPFCARERLAQCRLFFLSFVRASWGFLSCGLSAFWEAFWIVLVRQRRSLGHCARSKELGFSFGCVLKHGNGTPLTVPIQRRGCQVVLMGEGTPSPVPAVTIQLAPWWCKWVCVCVCVCAHAGVRAYGYKF